MVAAANMPATVHRLGVRAVATEEGNGDLVRPSPPGERLARLEEAMRQVTRRFDVELPQRLTQIEQKLDREIHDMRYDLSRLEGYQEQTLREMALHKRELSDKIDVIAGMWRDQQTRNRVWGGIGRWAERIIGWGVALGIGYYGAHHIGEPPHTP